MNIEDFYSIINRVQRGLTIVPLRTGMSKTYSAINFIEDIHSKGISEYKRIVFITNKKNNIPYKELKNIYEQHGNLNLFDKEVLYLESKFDSIIHHLPTRISHNTCPESFAELREKVDLYISNSSSEDKFEGKINEKEYIKSLIDSDNSLTGEFGLEKKFRFEIKDILNKAVGNNNIASKKELVRNNKDYQWIAKVYPQIFMEDYKVILMNTSKFNAYYDPIIRNSKKILSDELITRDSMIIFDEFDQTKKVFLKNIVDEALRNKGNIFNDFLSFGQNLTQDITNKVPEINADESQKILTGLKSEYESIRNKYYVHKTWLLNSNRNKHGLIFFNGSVTSLINRNSNNRLSNVFDQNDNQVNMEIVKYDSPNTQNNESINLVGAIFSINKFLLHLRTYFLKVTQKVIHRELKQTSDLEIRKTPEDILSSIMGVYKLNPRQVEIMLEDIYFSKSQKRKAEITPGMDSFYEFGLKTIFLENRLSNAYVTEFNTYNVWNTPESIILSLCANNHVIGLSATGTIQSNLVNYDLFYLQKQLGKRYADASDFFTDETKEKIKILDESYVKNNVDINVKTTEDVKQLATSDVIGDQGKLKNQLEKVLKLDPGVIKNIARELSVLDINDFALKRYLEIIKAMYIFLKDSSLESFLCLTQKGVKKDDHYLRRSTLEKIFNQLKSEFNYKSTVGFEVLVGKNFENNKKRILSKLESGEKIFLMSTYATLGDGQNLQYKPNNTDNLIQIVDSDFSSNEDQRFNKKDFDGIYLGEVTFITENLISDNFDLRNFLNYLIQIEYLVNGYEISQNEERELLKIGMHRISSNQVDDLIKNISLKEKISSRRAALITVVQAVGRLTRTFLKNKVQILISYDLLRILPLTDLKEMKDNHILSPEMKRIFSFIEDSDLDLDLDKDKDQQASRELDSKTRRTEFYINSLLNGFNKNDKSWTIDAYEQMKNDCLKNPTINIDEMGRDRIYETYFGLKNANQYGYKYDKDDKSYRYNDESEPKTRVSFETSRLPIMLKCKLVKDYFIKNNYATEFKTKDYIMNPVLFKNIFKGTIGEKAGVAILEGYRDFKLERFMKKGYYEYFDYSLDQHDDILFDFKNWDSSFDKDSEEELNKVSDKLNEVEGKIVFIINIIGEESWKSYQTNDNRIHVIPSLMDNKGNLNKHNLNKIFQIIEESR